MKCVLPFLCRYVCDVLKVGVLSRDAILQLLLSLFLRLLLLFYPNRSMLTVLKEWVCLAGISVSLSSSRAGKSASVLDW